LLPEVLAAFERLHSEYAVIVEGAGSPAEVNLRANDIANMGFAEAVDCRVLLVADIPYLRSKIAATPTTRLSALVRGGRAEDCAYTYLKAVGVGDE
jgi:hypothetical protein